MSFQKNYFISQSYFDFFKVNFSLCKNDYSDVVLPVVVFFFLLGGVVETLIVVISIGSIYVSSFCENNINSICCCFFIVVSLFHAELLASLLV